MPNPKKGESKDKFISRCISYVMNNEGITDTDHAYAKCNGIWNQSKKKSILKRIWKNCISILKNNE